VGQGKEQGEAWRGEARLGWARNRARRGEARHGTWCGWARNRARLGLAWLGRARRGTGFGAARSSKAGRGLAGQRQQKGEIHMSSLYFGGVPTRPDVDKIRKMWPDKDLKEGDEIAYEDMEELLDISRRVNRWRTVTNNWRGLVETESGLIIDVIKGKAFVVLDDGEKVDLGHSKMRTAVRGVRRSVVINSYVNTSKLDEDQLVRYRIAARCAAAMLNTAQLRSKKKHLPEM